MKFRYGVIAMITLCVLLNVLPINVQARNWRVRVYGCLAGGSSTAELTEDQISVSTSNAGFNTSVMQDITVLDSAFGVNIPVYFINDGEENAFFTPTRFPSLLIKDGADPNMSVTGSVFVGFALLNKEYRETNGTLMSIPAILGHEFAHAMQYKNDFPYNSKWRELHADYMAGWFIGHRGRFRPQNALQALINFYRKGDYDFFDPGHHGTPQPSMRDTGLTEWEMSLLLLMPTTMVHNMCIV